MRVVTVQEAVERLVRRPVRKDDKPKSKGRHKPTDEQRKKFMKQPPRTDHSKNERLRELAAARRRQGLPPTIPYEDHTPQRNRRVLQVQSTRFPGWGTIAVQGVGDTEADLEDLMTGWVLNGYFGFDAQYRIVNEMTKELRRVY